MFVREADTDNNKIITVILAPKVTDIISFPRNRGRLAAKLLLLHVSASSVFHLRFLFIYVISFCALLRQLISCVCV